MSAAVQLDPETIEQIRANVAKIPPMPELMRERLEVMLTPRTGEG